jgi:N-acetylmuramoyl-L-alanine amidase
MIVAEFAVAGELAHIHDIRLWRSPESTRIVFDLDNQVEHKMQFLENPDRVVLDVANAVMAMSVEKVNLKGTPISSFRTEPHGSNNLRITLVLGTKVTPKSFFLKKNPPMDDRLVLDLIDRQESVAEEISRVHQKTSSEEEAADIDELLNSSSVKTISAASAMQKVEEEQKQISQETHYGRRDLIIAVDAGHGGEDPGALGPDKIREKDVVLQIAKKLQDNFNRQKGYKVVMVRTGDYYVGLTQRRDIARKANADMFISIHADAFTRPSAHGSSVYALSSQGATSASAQFLADKENQSDLVGGVSLDDKDAVLSSVLVDLSMTYKMESSLEVGSGVLRKMGNISRLHSQKVEQAAFAVLKTPDIPSILVETGFISNHEEAKKLNSAHYQQKMADAIYHGINDYFLRKAPEGTYIAWIGSQQALDGMHVVAKGDTLSEIARRYAVSMASLIDYNKLRSSDVRVGQELKIPARR